MVVMPAFGIMTAYFLRGVMTFPPNVDASYLLVVMIVTATPTANNIAVMVTYNHIAINNHIIII